jgi:dUTPase
MFKVLTEGCEPIRGSKYSACIDLYAAKDVLIGAGETVLVPLGVCIDLEKLTTLTGISSKGHPHFLRTHYLQLMLRSSLSKELIIANGVGVVDLDFKDEIMIRLYKPMRMNSIYDAVCEIEENNTFQIKKGDRVAQIMLCEHKSYLFGIESEEERVGGFGSTGK